MKECIERDAVHDAVSKLKRLAWQSSTTSPNAESCVAVELDAVHVAVKNIPAAHVRPVVLCKDCKHNKAPKVWRFLDLEDVTADCSAGHGYPPMDWFCADGEKRSGDGAT